MGGEERQGEPGVQEAIRGSDGCRQEEKKRDEGGIVMNETQREISLERLSGVERGDG